MSDSTPPPEREPGPKWEREPEPAAGPESEPGPVARSSATRVRLAEEPDSEGVYQPVPDEPPYRAKRFWSARRVPATLTAIVVLGLSGLFLYDISAVRADREAMSWRRRLADELATRHLDDVWVITGAAVAAALGLWLIVLAATPGERDVLPMARRGRAGIRAGLDRRAAELVLRDRAMEVAGIRWARVDVGRRKARIRAASHFRELDAVRADLTTALAEAVRQLGLARQPQLNIHVQRAEKKG